jgi:hypothetical protein
VSDENGDAPYGYDPDRLEIGVGEPEEDEGDATGRAVTTRSGYRNQQDRIKAERREETIFWQGVFANPVGRRVMWDLFSAAGGSERGIFGARFAFGPAGFPDALASWHSAGERDFALRLYRACLARDLHGVHLMHEEHDPDFASFRGRKPRQGKVTDERAR